MTADPDDQAFTELELDHIGEDEIRHRFMRGAVPMIAVRFLVHPPTGVNL